MRIRKLAIVAAMAASAIPLSVTAAPVDEQAAPVVQRTPEQVQSYVLGNLYFLAYHELGHAMVSEFDVPILGREEDGVDRLATWMMTPDDGSEEPEYLIETITGWFNAAMAKSLDQIAWWDQHGTEEQRAFQVACLLYGEDPPRYKDIADAAGIPPERRPGCQKEAKQNDKSWVQLLKPYYRSGKPEDAASKDTVTMTYAPTQSFEAERAMMIKDGVLEELRRLITEEYQFKPGITLSAEDCGEPNAFWKKEERKLLICYDLVREFRRTAETPIQISPDEVQN